MRAGGGMAVKVEKLMRILLGVWCAVVSGLGGTAWAGESFSFRTEILPILTKAGCNAGACHGAATGQGGFRLSLLGYDPEEDYERITREFEGRRIDLGDPEASLILRKPSRQLEHEGGLRLPRKSEGYKRLVEWIAAGAPYGSRELEVSGIQVTPDERLLSKPGESFPIRVHARLSDGTEEDVTGWALYSSNDEGVAHVSKEGEVTALRPGLTSIMVRFGGQVGAVRVAVPFGEGLADAGEFVPENFIDRHILEQLIQLGLQPSGLCTDATFLRRVHLDIAGRLPTAAEVRAFLSEKRSAADRKEVVDRLLGSESYVDFWTLRLADWLLLGGKPGSDEGTRAYYEWLRRRVASNRPINEIVFELLTASGDLATTGPANFYTLASDPRDLAEHASRMFLGTQIACARCHAHPSDRWTQLDYHRFAAYFARVSREGERVMLKARGEVDDPKRGMPLMPKPLGERAAGTIGPEADRRLELAEWVTAPENPFFARSFVNRVWKHLLGRGLVEPVDDLRPTNPATHPELLERLAEEFVRSGFDLQHLIRTIVSSRTYQLDSTPVPGSEGDDRLYSHAYLKELSGQVFLDAVSQVTGVAESFEGYPEGTRAVELVSARTPSYALDVLGRCSREGPCEGAAVTGGGVSKALHLINGMTLNGKLRGVVEEWIGGGLSDGEIVEDLYARAYSRFPSAAEMAEWKEYLRRAENRKEAAEDLVWGVLNSREFGFNH